MSVCHACGGAGTDRHKPCETCGGEGRVEGDTCPDCGERRGEPHRIECDNEWHLSTREYYEYGVPPEARGAVEHGRARIVNGVLISVPLEPKVRQRDAEEGRKQATLNERLRWEWADRLEAAIEEDDWVSLRRVATLVVEEMRK